LGLADAIACEDTRTTALRAWHRRQTIALHQRSEAEAASVIERLHGASAWPPSAPAPP
jgi:16S rRNA C1402 (ribose-2'-O) methylase RsmI